MTKDPRIFNNTESFLEDFFQDFGEQTKIRPTDYFCLFQKPLDFSTLLERCLPSNPPRFVLLDGQSRAGKTWTAVGLVRELLESKQLDAVWSSGEDSRCIYSDGREPVADGIRKVTDSLASFCKSGQSNSPVRLIVLLDDFFGSARLRPLASNSSDLQLVKDCLTSDSTRNPILRSLISNQNVQASLLMTGRSSIFAMAEIRLNVQLGNREGRAGRGFFQRVDGTLIGAGASEWLDICLKQHRQFVRKHKEFRLPPMSAFSSAFQDDVSFDELSEILFGGDLRAIIDDLDHSKRVTEVLHGSFDPQAQIRLRQLLLVYVAPALVLPFPSIDSCLTGEDDSKRVREVLSLQPEEHGDFALRVPNRYYLRAIQQELLETQSLMLLADSLIAHAEELEKGCGKHMHVLSRGLIERGLESVGEVLEQPDNEREQRAEEIRNDLSTKVPDLPGAKDEFLLQWEATLLSDTLKSQTVNDQIVTDVAEKVPGKPGLASAIGWGLYRFQRNRRIESVTLEKICGAFENSAKNLGEQVDHRVLTVAYSNFIRWTAQMEEAPAKHSPIHQLAQVPASMGTHHPAKAALMMVLEDALIWADSFKLKQDTLLSVRNLPPAHDLWNALESESQEPSTAAPRDAFSIVNRLFSLEWHNEWKERPGYRREVLHKWLQSNQKSALDLIQEGPKGPKLLDENLAYHWSHMITQWSVWARDWCFSPDPNAHEYHKEPIGCRDQSNNKGIHKILKQVIDSAFEPESPPNRLRNAFFLLAIRSGGSPHEGLAEVHEHLGEVIERASSASEDIKRDLVQAIYELIRQGYLDRTEAGASLPQGDDRKHQLPMALCTQCVKFLNLHRSDDEWTAYLKELDGITCLDVLPQTEKDLIPYGRGA